MRRIALATYGVILLLWCNEYGVPIGHDYIFLWIIIGLACASIGRTWKSILHLLVDWGPFLLVVIAYDLSRGWADGAGFPVHFTPQIDADKVLFLGHVPTEWLERNLYHTDIVVGFSGGRLATAVQPTVPVQWFEVVFDLTYLSHYLASFVLAGVLWIKSRARFQAYVRRFATLSALGFLTYVRVPGGSPVDGGATRFPRPRCRPHRRTRLRVAPPPHRAQHDRHRRQDDESRRRRTVAARRLRHAGRHHPVAERAEMVPAASSRSIPS